ncbi:MFS transporter [Rhodoligotrophos ferricapiens]|uniref:MFS transporter n=1 Tax=Rhodoligotrophos ferricapiens TaxID=3069264 RepID=UPI00315C7295
MSTDAIYKADVDSTTITTAESRKAIAAGVWGTVVEWYDYAVYGFLATIIAQHFFPSADDTTALLSAFAAFGLGFVARPLGGIAIGWLGDARGRKTALVLTLFLMAVSTVGIGLLPTYASIGVAAPVLLVVCRLVQGFSAGGEWGGSTAFIVEWAPSNRRGLFGSLQQASVAGGLLIGSGVAAIVASILMPEQMSDWGWRIPFLLGGILLPLGMYIRRNVEDTPAFRAVQEQNEKPREMPWRAAGQAFGFTILWTVSFYIMLSYMPTFTQKYAGLSRTEALWSNTIGLVAVVIAIPLMGRISDRVGRKPLILASVVSFLVLSYPLFSLMLAYGNFAAAVVVQIIFGLMLASFSGPGPAAIAEIFPTNGRSTWMSTAYSLSVAIFGGFAPYIATWLISATGSPLAPTFYLMIAAAISTLVVLTLRETAHSKLM